MDSKMYQDILAHKQQGIKDKLPFWEALAKKYKTNQEKLRSDFRREYMRKGDNLSHPLPKIVLMDIETLPIKAFTWGLWDQNVGINQIIADWTLLSWSAKQLFDSHIISDIMTSKEAVERDDLRITQSLWKVVDDADIVIAHNGIGFDFRKMNTRFLVHELMPPRRFEIIDTLDVIKKNFGLSSNKLEFIAELLVNDHKIKTDFELWRNCDAGDPTALAQMETYNQHDVEVLEEVYLKIRPWIRNHPNLGAYSSEYQKTCNNCGSTNILANGEYHTSANIYNSFRCGNCGALMRGRKGILNNDKREILLRN